MAPRGRQNTTGREARNPTRTSRGGISKRKAGRVDGDGDMDMDSAGRRAKKTPTTTTATRSNPTRSSTRTSTRGGPSKKAQNVIEALTNGTAGSLASRVSNVGSGRTPKTRSRDMTGLTMLRVGGLKESKAASNAGGGVNDLLGFMERKAGSFRTNSKRKVAIKKVCFVIDKASGAEYSTRLCETRRVMYRSEIDICYIIIHPRTRANHNRQRLLTRCSTIPLVITST
jgi:nuclear RNA export factor